MDQSQSEAAEPTVSDSTEDADVYTNQKTFLRKIHTGFLKFVQPIESPLVDELVAGGIMSSDDEKEVSAKETRRDKARHLWNILHRVPPELLEKKCLPAMKKHYPHVLERATFRWDGKMDPTDHCLRHAIMKRMRLRRFADIFPPANACTQVEYRTITECSDVDETQWDFAFQLCVKHKNNVELLEMLTQALNGVGLPVPRYFHRAFSARASKEKQPLAKDESRQEDKVPGSDQKSGKLPGARGRKRSREMQLDGLQKLGKRPRGLPKLKSQVCVSSTGYASTKEDRNASEGRSVSISSSESKRTIVTEREDEKQETQFETRDQKEIYLKQMEEINAAIRQASNIRTIFRELTGVSGELNILREKAKSETATQMSFPDAGKIQRLEARARHIYGTIERDFEEASQLTKRVEETKLDFDFQLPFAHKTTLLVRRQTLVNEMKEATPFFRQSKTLFPTMAIPEVSKEESLKVDVKPLPLDADFDLYLEENIFDQYDDSLYQAAESDFTEDTFEQTDDSPFPDASTDFGQDALDQDDDYLFQNSSSDLMEDTVDQDDDYLFHDESPDCVEDSLDQDDDSLFQNTASDCVEDDGDNGCLENWKETEIYSSDDMVEHDDCGDDYEDNYEDDYEDNHDYDFGDNYDDNIDDDYNM